jgi:hypothetical protein
MGQTARSYAEPRSRPLCQIAHDDSSESHSVPIDTNDRQSELQYPERTFVRQRVERRNPMKSKGVGRTARRY